MIDRDFTDYYGPAALVTGASSGIGKSFAELLAGNGMDLVLVARRAQRLEQLAARLRQDHGVKAHVCPIDLAEVTAAQQILDATASVDIGLLISNAGFGLKGAFAGGDAKAMARSMKR